MDKLNDDCLYMVLSFLPFTDKVLLQRVNKKWKETLTRLLRLQKSIGNSRTKVVSRCSNSMHWIGPNDILSKQLLTNLTILPIILKKCPDLRAIAITKLKEMNYEEAALAKRNAFQCQDNDDDDDDESDMIDEVNESNANCSYSLEVRRRIEARMMQRKRKMMHKMVRRPPSPRPCNEEDFLNVLSKYAPKLECIDISGLKLNHCSGASAQDGGTWRKIGIECAENLCHLRTNYITDHELSFLIKNCPRLKDIGACMGAHGIPLSRVGENFERLEIFCLRLSGLREFIKAGVNVANLKTISLNNVNKEIIEIVWSHFKYLEKLSLRLQVSTVTPSDLSKLSTLRYLKRLSLKRREGKKLITRFDQPFNEIQRNCQNLTTIILENLHVTDASIQNLQLNCLNLREFRLSYHGNLNRRQSLSDQSILSLSTLNNLKIIRVDYPNIITEHGVIDFLLTTKSIEDLRISQCKELIPIPQIIEAAVKFTKTCASTLRVTLSTGEKIAFDPSRQLLNIIPENLFISIITALDNWSNRARFEEDSSDEGSEADIGKITFDWEDGGDWLVNEY